MKISITCAEEQFQNGNAVVSVGACITGDEWRLRAFRRRDCRLLAAHIFQFLCFIECIGVYIKGCVRIKGMEEIVWITASDLNKEGIKKEPPIKDSTFAAEKLT